MLAEADLAEYLTEIRAEVCSRCVEKPAGGPPCMPLGKACGVEMHLAELVESIHEVYSPTRIDPYLQHDRDKICAHRPYLHSSICPCPMDYLLVLIVQAVETVDRRRDAGGATLCLWRNAGTHGPADLDAARRAHAAAKGQWEGCDWDTVFGQSRLNLNGCRACEAEKHATEDRSDRNDWRIAAIWLRRVEESASEAQCEGTLAVAAAALGNWTKAARHAYRAWALEFASGRALARGFPLTWQPLREITEAAQRAMADTAAK